MDRSKITTLALTALCLAQGAWIAATHLLGDARAQDPAPATLMDPPPAEARASSLLCRLFDTGVASGSMIESADRTTEVGQWVGEQQDDGWRLFSVDFEVGQKATGYPQGYLQVCLSRT